MAKPGRTDWQIGAVLKQKMNSQGTLFRGGTKYSSDKRYPRGYTPERQQEVADAVVQPSTKRYTDERGTVVSTGTQSANFKDRKVRGSGSMSDDNLYHESRQPMRDLVDNIARSTVPVEDLRSEVEPGRKLHFWVGHSLDKGLQDSNAAGNYQSHPPGVGMRSDIKVGTPFVQGTTPIHEIGHHVDAVRDIEQFGVANAVNSGRKEGFADAYSYEHFRDRRGNRAEGIRVYPKDHYFPDDETKQRLFAAGYGQSRGDVPAPADPMAKYFHPQPMNNFQRGKEAEAAGETLFKTWDNGDGTVDFEVQDGPDPLYRRKIGQTPKGPVR